MSDMPLTLEVDVVKEEEDGGGAEVNEEEMPIEKDDKEKDEKEKEEEVPKKGVQTQTGTERQLMPSVGGVPIMPAVMADGSQMTVPDAVNMQKQMTGFTGAKMDMEEDRKGKRRRIYQTDEERRTARILKNRRTAEESRQRRLQRMKELEALNNGAQERESKLRWEITELREELAARIADVNRLTEELEKARKDLDDMREQTAEVEQAPPDV